MQQISKWVARDKSEHATEAACVRYERIMDECERALSDLPKRPEDDGCQFSNGHGRIEHVRFDVQAACETVLAIAKREMGTHDWLEKWWAAVGKDGAFHYRHSMLCRLIDDMAPAPVRRAWNRFGCFDDNYNEYGQPYYALNPDKVKEPDR